jgi:hypothetical protein
VIEDYLNRLRASLRTSPAETERVIAEAEDHLRESVAARMAAGLTEAEAREAAIAAFGSVPEIVRAHMTAVDWVRPMLTGLLMAVWKLGWLMMLTFGTVWLLFEAASGALWSFPLAPTNAVPVVGLLLAIGYRRVRARHGAVPAGSFPLVATVFFAALIPVTLVQTQSGQALGRFLGLVLFVFPVALLAIGYAGRLLFLVMRARPGDLLFRTDLAE